MGRRDRMGEIVVPVADPGAIHFLCPSFWRKPESREAVDSCFYSFHSPGGRPGAGHFSCAAKQSNQKKAAPGLSRLRVPCVTRRVRGLWNSLSE